MRLLSLVILAILMILVGCVETRKSLCRHNAVYAATTWSDLTQLPVGVAVGFTDSSKRHAQAFTVDSTLETNWLKVTRDGVGVGERDNFYPYVFMTVREFEEKYLRVVDYKEEAILLFLH